MPLEPRLRILMAVINRANPDYGKQFMPLMRATEHRQAHFSRVVIRKGKPVKAITHHMVPVDGGEILVRLYRPHDGTLPLHVYFHGGGFCLGNLDQRDDRCKDLAVDAGCVVASVDYRMAPENKYPIPPEDCYAALCWLVDHATDDDINIDVRAVSVGGESAGATLATVAALMAKDRNGPRLAFQMLEVPATDLTLSQPSIKELARGYMLELEGMQEFMRNYVDPARAAEPYASPLFAPDLSGLPPTWILTCEYDPLHSDGEAYRDRLIEAGVPVQYQQLAGHIHPSFALNRLTASSRQYLREAGSALRAAHRAAVNAVATH